MREALFRHIGDETGKSPIRARIEKALHIARRILPYALTLAYLVALGIAASRHEMWRDEIQAWLLARDCPTLWAIMKTIKYEGHTGLWHLILWPFTRISTDPMLMLVAHVTIAGAAVFVLLRFAPFAMPVRILVACGYFFAYEWAVIARNYAISVLLIFIFCALYEKRWRRFPVLAMLLFALCHTNIHSILVVIVLLPVLLIEFAVSYAGKFRDADKCLARVLAGFLIVAAGLYTSIKQIAPPPDTGFATEWFLKSEDGRYRWIASTMINAYLPVPAERANFWGSNRFQERPRDDSRIKWSVPDEDRIRFVWWTLALCSLLFIKRPWLVVPYVLSTFALLTFFYVKYPGSYRHHGFLFLVFVALLWMSFHYKPWKLPWRRADLPFDFWDRHRANILVPLFVIHVWGAWTAVKFDWKTTFSQAEATAEWIRSEYPDTDKYIFIGADGPAVSAVVGYLRIPKLFYTQRGEFGSYMIWDNKNSRHNPTQFRREVRKMMVESGKSAILIFNVRLPEHITAIGMDHLKSFEGAIVGDENFHVYFWKNTCPNAPAVGGE